MSLALKLGRGVVDKATKLRKYCQKHLKCNQSQFVDTEDTELISTIANINDLPVEILIEIFSYLPAGCWRENELLDASLVCKQWNRVISGTACLMNKVELYNINEKKSTIKKIAKRHRNVDLANFSVHDKKVMSKIRLQVNKVEDSLTTLTLRNAVVDHAFMALLSTCRHIKALSIEFCEWRLNGDDDQSDQSFKFARLRRLKIARSSPSILENFKCSHLDSLNFFQIDRTEVHDSLIKFLNQLERLDELVLWFGSDFKFFRNELSPKFKWRKFQLTLDGIRHPDVNKLVMRNMKALCKASIARPETNIRFHAVDYVNLNDFCDLILNSCAKVTELAVSCNKPTYSFVNYMRKLQDVWKLETVFDQFKSETFADLVMKLPNVTHLEMGEIFEVIDFGSHWELLQPFLDQITHLKTLGPNFLTDENNAYLIEFKNLTTLNVMINDPSWLEKGIDHLKKFCSLNRKLTHLIIRVEDWELTDLSLITLFDELHADTTSVKTCEIQLLPDVRATFTCEESKQLELFGKVLSNDEKQFFIC